MATHEEWVNGSSSAWGSNGLTEILRKLVSPSFFQSIEVDFKPCTSGGEESDHVVIERLTKRVAEEVTLSYVREYFIL